MSKIIVEVHIPSIDKVHDVKLPGIIYVWQAADLISQAVEYLYPEMYSAKNRCILCDYSTGTVLNMNIRIYESGLKNGSQIILL